MNVLEPIWLGVAREYIGLKETPGVDTNPTILGWLTKLNAWWHNDATPWCGVYVAYCLQSVGIAIPREYMRAKAWLKWGTPLGAPVLGCIVVFARTGGGHVGFVVGEDDRGNLLVQIGRAHV